MDNRDAPFHFSTKIYNAYLRYLDQFYPQVDTDQICRDCGLSRAQILNEKWLSIQFEVLFSRRCIEVTGDHDLHRKVGRMALERDLLGPVLHGFLSNLASTSALYRIAPSATETMTNVYQVIRATARRGNVVYIVRCSPEHLTPAERTLLPEVMTYAMRSLQGYYEAVPTLKNAPFASVSIVPSSDSAGYPTFVIDVKYQPSSNLVLLHGALTSAISGGAALGCVYAGAQPLAAGAVFAAIFFAAVAAMLLHAFRKQWTVAHDTIKTLDELKVEQIRSQAATKLAESRAKQLEAISDVARSVTFKASRADLMTQACRSLVQRLGYDRAIIFLADESRRRLVYTAHAGDETRVRELFFGVEFDIDIPSSDPAKIANVFRSRKSWLVADVMSHLPTLNGESQALLRQAESKSFMCVPISSGENCFGIIIADHIRAGREINRSDLDLVTTVGQQLAVAIERLDAQQREVAAIRDSIKIRQQFLANATHELKTPLNGIVGLAEALRDEPTCRSEPRAMKSLQLIVASGRRLADLVDDVLALAKSEHAARTIERSETDFGAICRSLTYLLGPQFTKKGLSFLIQIDSAATRLWIDGARIEQVLTNLLSNALKFTERGRVEMDVAVRDGGDVAFTVADTGIGIASGDLPHIFEAYFQASGNGPRRSGGTGLGLAIAREIVQAHGGQLEATSKLGDGSAFSFILRGAARGNANETQRLRFEPEATPLAPDLWTAIDSAELRADPVAGDPRIVSSDNIRGDHILIVDDDETNLQVLVNHLTPLNYQVTTAHHGEQCLELVSGGLRPDLILLDVMMPGLNGYDVCRRLREQHSLNDLPIIFLTARSQESDTLEALQAGGSDFVRKPFVKAELMARIALHSQLSRYARVTGRFVPWRGLEWLGYKSVLEVRLGEAVDMDLTVLFSDLRDFTRITERMSPRDIMRMINSYIGATAPVISDCGGMIDKFMGDGMMALFRRPSDGIRAAVQLMTAVNAYNHLHRAGGQRIPLSCRLALNSGPVTFGPMGYQERLEITPISSMINAASRMDGIAKDYGALIIAAEATVITAGVDPTQIPYRRLGPAQIRGQEGRIPIVEILAADPEPIRSRKLRSLEAFEENVHHLGDGSVSRALEGFLALAKVDPEDQAVQYFLSRCQTRIVQMVADTRTAA